MACQEAHQSSVLYLVRLALLNDSSLKVSTNLNLRSVAYFLGDEIGIYLLQFSFSSAACFGVFESVNTTSSFSSLTRETVSAFHHAPHPLLCCRTPQCGRVPEYLPYGPRFNQAAW